MCSCESDVWNSDCYRWKVAGAGWEDTGRDRCRDTGGQADTLVGDLTSTVLESREESDDVVMVALGQMGMAVG